MNNFILGCDVSKDDLHTCLLDVSCDKIIGSRKFPNNTDGVLSLMTWTEHKCNGKECSVVMEATGVYHENMVDILYNHDFTLYVVTPKIIKHYIANHNRRYKNDRSDAYMIACFGASIGTGINKVDIKPWEPYSPFYAELRAYSRQIVSLQKSIVQFKNKLEALKSTNRTPQTVIDSTQTIIDTIEDTIQDYKNKLKHVIDYDDGLKTKIQHISTIKGVGWLTAIHIICATDGFRHIENSRQLVAFAGLDVPEEQSGRCSKPGRISKCGNSLIRHVLYMPAMGASCMPTGIWHSFYFRIHTRSGGKAKKGIVAVMRKMLCLIYTLWRDNADFDPNHKWCPTQKSDIQEAGASFVQTQTNNNDKKEEAIKPPHKIASA